MAIAFRARACSTISGDGSIPATCPADASLAAGKLPDKAPVVTSAANPHYQKRFDELHKLYRRRRLGCGARL